MLSEDSQLFNSIKQQSFPNVSLLYVSSFFYALANCKEQAFPIIWSYRGVQKQKEVSPLLRVIIGIAMLFGRFLRENQCHVKNPVFKKITTLNPLCFYIQVIYIYENFYLVFKKYFLHIILFYKRKWKLKIVLVASWTFISTHNSPSHPWEFKVKIQSEHTQTSDCPVLKQREGVSPTCSPGTSFGWWFNLFISWSN